MLIAWVQWSRRVYPALTCSVAARPQWSPSRGTASAGVSRYGQGALCLSSQTRRHSPGLTVGSGLLCPSCLSPQSVLGLHCRQQPAFSLAWVSSIQVASGMIMALPKIISGTTCPFPWLMQGHCWPLLWVPCLHPCIIHSFSIYWALTPGLWRPWRSKCS